MAWSYEGKMATRAMDRVRFLIGDTDPSRPLTEDSEVAYAISINPDADALAGAFLADALAARYEQSSGVSLAGLGTDFTERAVNLRGLARNLRNLATGGINSVGTPIAPPVVTGISVAEYLKTRQQDPDRIPLMTEQDEGDLQDRDYSPYVGGYPPGIVDRS